MDVFTFLDPYMVLQHYYQLRKNHEESFSYTVWADELALNSSSTLRMMVNGKKKLSRGVAEKFLQRCFTGSDEKNYFRLLVAYAHAPTIQEKNAAWSALSTILSGRIAQQEATDYFTYVSDLILPKIQTILSFEDTEWTVTKLSKVLDSEESIIVDALKKLENIGMAKQFGTNDVISWKAEEKLIKVSDRLGDVALTAYHNASLDEAKAAQSLPKEIRRYRSLLVPLNQDEFQNLMGEVEKFTKQLITRYQANRYQGRKLYKLNLNYYPVTKDIEV